MWNDSPLVRLGATSASSIHRLAIDSRLSGEELSARLGLLRCVDRSRHCVRATGGMSVRERLLPDSSVDLFLTLTRGGETFRHSPDCFKYRTA